MTGLLKRDLIFPEPRLPDSAALIANGRARAAAAKLGSCPFLREAQVPSEAAYKRRQMRQGRLMLHAQIGYRDPAKSRRAWREIHGRVAEAGGRVDRYGICLDWSMGYPADQRPGRPKGTGLVLPDTESWAALSAEAPVAPHFGDFVLGMPAALENCLAALGAGATTIGNLGQYFTFPAAGLGRRRSDHGGDRRGARPACCPPGRDRRPFQPGRRFCGPVLRPCHSLRRRAHRALHRRGASGWAHRPLLRSQLFQSP